MSISEFKKPAERRFQRVKYVNRLFEMRAELEQWQQLYRLEGKNDRADALEGILTLSDHLLNKFADYRLNFGS